MIAHLAGTIMRHSADHVIVMSFGVGRLVQCSKRTTDLLRDGMTYELEIEEIAAIGPNMFRVDLYGFMPDTGDRELFNELRTVKSVGPKAALAITGKESADVVWSWIAAGSVKLISTVKGIGPKAAERIVEKLGPKARRYIQERDAA